jgi:hypothetical protein
MKIFANLWRWPGLIVCALTLVLIVRNACSTNPVPAAQQTLPEVRALSGSGEHYEVILKYSAFTMGSEVSLTAYVLDKATNEPIRGATLSGSMSSGSESLPCLFTERSQSIAGAYQGTIHVADDEPYSWLLDISHGDISDLVAIDGFKTGNASKGISPPAVLQAKEPPDSEFKLTITGIVGLLATFTVLQVVLFFIMRKRFSLIATAKDPR